MNPENRSKLAGRVVKVAEAALAARHYVSPVEVLVGIGWLDPGAVERWRQGRMRGTMRVSGSAWRAPMSGWNHQDCSNG